MRREKREKKCLNRDLMENKYEFEMLESVLKRKQTNKTHKNSLESLKKHLKNEKTVQKLC
jgi:hypothetical protein